MTDPGHAHRQALDLMRAQDWDQAGKLLEPLAQSCRDPWLVNDLAVARHQAGDTAAAVEIFNRLGDAKTLPAAVRLNRLYLAKAHELSFGFDPAWQPLDFEVPELSGPDPKVSVITCTYKRPDFLREALASIKAQTFTDFEVIVANDGGDPASERIARESGLPRLRYVMLPHRGHVPTYNTAFTMARGEYITGVDDDDVIYPNHLATLVSYLDQPGAAPVAYGDYRVATYGRKPDGTSGPVAFRDVRAKPYVKGVLFETNPLTIFLMARRSCFAKVGRFIESFELAEDWEMWLRLAAEFDIAHVPEITAEVRERPGDANLTYRRLRKKYFWDNVVLYMHRGLYLLSGPKVPEMAGPYRKTLALLDGFLAAHPGSDVLLNLRGLWNMKRPYAWFADQGRWFLQMGEPGQARELYKCAARLAPFEPKVWAGMIKSLSAPAADKTAL